MARKSHLKKTITAFAAVGLFFLLAVMPALSAAETESAAKKSFIWEVKGPQGKCYLLGSIHLLKKEHYPLPAAMEKAFDEAEIVAVEADISNQEAIGQMTMLTLQKGMYQGEQTLENTLDKKTYQLLLKYLKENDMTIDSFQKFKPWLLAMTLTSIAMVKQGFDPNMGIDKYFLEKAKDKKEIKELEGLTFQINLLSGFSEEEGEKFLFYSLQESDTESGELDGMVSAWVAGDAEAMAEVVIRTAKKFPELKGIYSKLIEERNFGMAEKVDSYLQTGKVHLVISGAAHLVGETGIINALEKKGYKVKQL